MLERYELFSASVFRIYRDIQRIQREEMEKYGLKGAFAPYLSILQRYPEGITSARLCEICDKDKAAVSRAVAEMELKGLLSRRSAGDNAYRARLCLTEAGLTAAEHVSRRAVLAVEAAGKGLSEEQRAVFYGALGQIADNLHTISREGIPSHESV